jgi:putative flavoprotein involved in K+ transport
MLIASGQISIISGHHITQFVPEGLVLQSNTSDFCANFVPSSVFLAAAHVVLCTGHESLLSTTRAIFGETLADAVGPIWGLDNEGEVKRVWRPSGVRGFWVVGGNLKAARWGIGALGVLVKALEVGACTWDDLGCV